jgi:hypothetical protein
VSALKAKAPEEVDDYRQCVRDIAESVANAAGRGETTESQAIAKVESALAGTASA